MVDLTEAPSREGHLSMLNAGKIHPLLAGRIGGSPNLEVRQHEITRDIEAGAQRSNLEEKAHLLAADVWKTESIV